MIMSVRNGRSNPCKDCPDRYIACSDHCQKPEFLAWKAEQETIRRNRGKYYETVSYSVDEIRKTRKRCRR